ncbi:flavin reductase family protein [Coralliovum pocilloporae]|uniref:flavin reductase family protein n=1 Tax=Coralliovum pocilloporae TaxID=3066369 RepID=UPI0033074253
MDRDQFIDVMRRVATPVSIVCTQTADGPHGATVSAICSVSADPPSVLVCLNNTSHISKMVAESGRFSVNVISEEQTLLANAFAGREAEKEHRRFDNGHWLDSPMGLPVLTNASAVLLCETTSSVVQGSHTIFIGHVQEAFTSDSIPVTYFNGAFRRMNPDGQAA